MKIKRQEALFGLSFYTCLLYLLMRPVLTDYVSELFKYFFLLCALWSIFIVVANRKMMKFLGKTEFFLCALFVVYTVITSLVYGGYELFRLSAERYIFYMFPILIFPCIRDRLNWDRMLAFMAHFGVIDSLISFIEFFTLKQIFPVSGVENTRVLQFNGSIRTYGLNGSYFILAEILCLCGLAALYLAKFRRKKWYLINFVVISAGVFSTGTRGFYVAYFIGVLILYFADGRSLWNRKKVIRMLVILFLSFVGLWILVGTDFLTGNSIIDKLLIRARSIFNWTTENANVTRIRLWKTALENWKSHILFGNGPDCTSTSYWKALPVTESGLLKRLVELGLVGTILQLSTMFYPLIKGLKRYRVSQNKNPLTIFMIALLGSFLFEDLILQMYTGLEYTILIWSAIAFVYYFSVVATN